jgi:death-on-curing protein
LPDDVVPPVHLAQCDRATIEAALGSPRAGFGGVEVYPDLPTKAAVLTYTLAKSQACIDGNKRIALILLNEFLSINGAALEMTDDAAVDMILEAAESDRADRDAKIAEMTQTLERSLVPLAEATDDETPEEAG